MKKEFKETYLKGSGVRMAVNACFVIGLYAAGGIAYEVGKKAIAACAVIAAGGILIGQIVDGIIVTKNNL